MTDKSIERLRSAVVAGSAIDFSSALSELGEDETQEAVRALCVLACPDCRLDMVDVFLAHGLAPDSRDGDDATILMWAAHWGCLSIIQRLISKGSDVNARDRAGRTPLMYAVDGQRLEAVKSLVLAGADTTCCDGQGRSAVAMATIAATGVRLPFGMHLSWRRQTTQSPIAQWLKDWQSAKTSPD